MDYSYKRKIYFELEASIKKNKASFLLGPRKCGKTVCLDQICKSHGAEYINVKSDYTTDDQRRDLVDKIISDISNDTDKIYLIDEATYLSTPDKDIAKIADAFSHNNESKTRIVFAGSQSKALEFWGHIAFAGNASFINCSFLNYSEWLEYKGTYDVSEESYIDFISNTREFYKDFISTKDYLQGCLDETVISNNRSIEYVLGNDVGEIDNEMLLDVLYAALISLHNHVRYQTFVDKSLLPKTIANQFATRTIGIKNEDLAKRTSDFLSERYSRFKNMDAYDCKKALQFLSNCGLVTVTYVTDDLNADPYIASKLLKESNDLYLKPQIFSRFNVTINYPMFIVDVISDILGEYMPTQLPRELLGSIVECQVRSLLPSSGYIMYRTENGEEIDAVSLSGKAIESSVRNKKNKETHFDLLPSYYEKVLLTRDARGFDSGITRIPYYEYIYKLSSNASYEHNLSSPYSMTTASEPQEDPEPDPTDDTDDVDI